MTNAPDTNSRYPENVTRLVRSHDESSVRFERMNATLDQLAERKEDLERELEVWRAASRAWQGLHFLAGAAATSIIVLAFYVAQALL